MAMTKDDSLSRKPVTRSGWLPTPHHDRPSLLYRTLAIRKYGVNARQLDNLPILTGHVVVEPKQWVVPPRSALIQLARHASSKDRLIVAQSVRAVAGIVSSGRKGIRSCV